MKTILLSTLTAAMASIALVGCGSHVDNVAVVNGETIPMTEYHKYLERKQVVIVQTDSGPAELPVAQPLGFQALRDLINRRILLQVAKDDGVFPTDADVANELNFQTKRDANFVRKLQAQGYNLEDIRRDLTLDLAKERIVTKGITIGPDEVDKFIKEHPEKFMQPEQASIRLIAVRDEATKASVDKDLAAGQPFQQVAVRYSVAPNVRQTQGMYAETVVDKMPTDLKTIVHSTNERTPTKWKQFGSDWVKFYIEQKAAAKPITIDDSIKTIVRRSLAMERGSQAINLNQRLVDKLRTSKVAVEDPTLKERWDQAFKTLQESDVQSKTTTGQGTAPAPGGAAPGGAAPATDAPK